jgi:uncharacterized RDD family membrane protein YckC
MNQSSNLSPSSSSQSSQYSRLRESLTIGELVSVAFTIARQRWHQHLGIALQGTAWLFIPIITIVLLMAMQSGSRGSGGLMVLLYMAWFVGALYCFGRYLANSALISRLGFNDLTQKVESFQEAKRYIRSRTWSYVGASVLMGLIFMVSVIVGAVTFSIIIGIVGAIFMPSLRLMSPTNILTNPVLIMVLAIGYLIVILGLLAAFTWLGSRFFFFEVPMSVEPEIGGPASIGRTWRLGARSNWRFMMTTTVGFLVTFPIQVLTQIVLLMILVIPQAIVGRNPSSLAGVGLLSTLVNLAVNFGFIVVTMVFWQTVKAVVYFDARNRSEGLGLVLSEKREERRENQKKTETEPVTQGLRFFNEIRLRTPESVELEFPLSGIGSRAFALFVDYTVLSLAIAVVLLIWGIISYQLTQYFPDSEGLGSWLIAIPFLLCFAIFVGYFVFFETLWQGQTPGKRLAQIRVIRDDGRPMSLPQATLRALLRIFDDLSFFVVGFLMIVIGKQEKRIGDWVAGTVVIQEHRSQSGKIQLFDQAKAQEVAGFLVDEQEISDLLPDDFAIVREYLRRRNKLSSQARETVSLKLAEQVKHRLALEGLPFNMSANTFLEGVYLAYQQQGQRDFT